jgi:hypothetical protein
VRLAISADAGELMRPKATKQPAMKFFMENLLQLFTLVAELVEEIRRIGGTDCELSISCVRNYYARHARDQVKAACIRDYVEPHGDDLPVPQPLHIALS